MNTASLAQRCLRIDSSTEIGDLVDFLADIDERRRAALERLCDEIERAAGAYLANQQSDAGAGERAA